MHLGLFNDRRLTEQLLVEVSDNHLKQEPIAVATTQTHVLQTALSELDFTLRLPPTIASTNELLGGLYCTLNNHKAAQLKISDKTTHDVKTLFIARLTPELQALGRVQKTHNRVNVTLWHDGDVFFALASSDIHE